MMNVSFSTGVYIYSSPYKNVTYVGIPHGVVANVLNCDIIVSKFKLQLHFNCIHFWTNALGKIMNLLIKSKIVPLLFFLKGGI